MSVPLRTRALWLALAAAAGLFAAAAEGADKARTTAAKPGSDRIMTPAQLKACLDRKAAVQTRTDAALKTKAELVADKAEIDRTGTALAESANTLDRTSVEAVDAYNAQVDERSKRIDAYQARLTAYNSEVESANADRDAYATACENRRYDDRDLADLKRKK